MSLSAFPRAVTDAVLDMAENFVGGLFAKARTATRQRYVASAETVGLDVHDQTERCSRSTGTCSPYIMPGKTIVGGRLR